MKRLVLTAAIAVLAAFPAAYGLIGNASFGESVPVRIPARATLIDDRNGFDDNPTIAIRRYFSKIRLRSNADFAYRLRFTGEFPPTPSWKISQ